MYGRREYTKEELINMIKNNFKDVSESEVIAILFFSGECDKMENQVIMFKKKID